MEIEQAVARHCAHGFLEESILNALAAAGKEVNRLTPKDLAPVDEFHVGGRQVSMAWTVSQLGGSNSHSSTVGVYPCYGNRLKQSETH